MGSRDQHPRHQRQRTAQIGKYICQCRDNLRHDDNQDNHRNRNDKQRIGHRSLDLLRRLVGLFVKLLKPVKGSFQRTRLLACPDRLDKCERKTVAILFQRRRNGTSGSYFLCRSPHDLPDPLVLILICQHTHRACHCHARMKRDRKL